MSCEDIQAGLAGFHFGVVSDVERAAVEDHLVACAGCLRAYLDVKRAVETGERSPAPSEAVRLRLRRAVAAELSREWSWWERPLAYGFAACAVVAAIVVMHAVAVAPASAPYGLSAGDELRGAGGMPR